VELLDRAILASLEKHPAGLTLKELMQVAADAVGDWPPDSLNLAMFSVNGHMERLEAQGRVRRDASARPVKWVCAR